MSRAVRLVRETMERVRALVDGVLSWVERTIFWRVWERLLENEFIDRSVALGAKAFVSLFPALLVVAAFTPSSVRHSILTTVARRAGLSGDGLKSVKGAFANTNDIRRTTGILGLIFTFFYVSSFTGALRRVYTKAWRRPAGGGISGYAVGASWLAGLAAYTAVLGLLRGVLRGGPETALFAVLAWAASVGMWWVTPWLMLQRQVRFRALSLTAVLTGTAMGAYALSAAIWMPHTMESNQRQFGFFGVTLALVTWLTGIGMVVVVCAVTGPVFAEDRGIIGRWVRGKTTSVLVPGATASFEAPIRAPKLSDAIGLRGDIEEVRGEE